jgi:hypothetical protein
VEAGWQFHVSFDGPGPRPWVDDYPRKGDWTRPLMDHEEGPVVFFATSWHGPVADNGSGELVGHDGPEVSKYDLCWICVNESGVQAAP